MSADIPPGFLDLVNGPPVAALSTLMPDGQPQTTVVWCDYDGRHVRVNTMRGFRKEKNMRRDPRVTLLLIDPEDTTRFMEIRGEVELTEAGAVEHLDALTRGFTAHPQFYGYVYPREQQARETRLIGRIRATRITLNAIHR